MFDINPQSITGNGTINIHGIPCEERYYCPIGSSIPSWCKAGYYCPGGIEPQLCSAGFYCPPGKLWQVCYLESECKNF